MPSCSAIYNGGPCSAQKWKRRGNLTPFDCVRPTQKRIPPKNREKNTHPTVRTVWAPPIIAAIKCYSSSSFFRLKVSPPKRVFYFLPFRERKLFDPCYRPCGVVGASVGICDGIPFRRNLFPYSINLAPKTERRKPTP